MSEFIYYDKIVNIFTALQQQQQKSECLDGTAFLVLLTLLRYQDAVPEANGIDISLHEIALQSFVSRAQVRSRLKLLACYSLITVEMTIGTKLTIKINPVLLYMLGHKNKVSKSGIAAYVGQCAKKAHDRLQRNAAYQGFGCVDCDYGATEALDAPLDAQAEIVNAMHRVEAKAEATKQSKADKQKEAFFWKRKSDEFVDGAAKVWSYCQARAGYADSRPMWSFASNELSATARRERQELVKTFQCYGGVITALAWGAFCSGRTDIDPNTQRPTYSHTEPHRQFVTTDRRPSQFVKYFNAILADREGFLLLLQKETWDKKIPGFYKFFGDVLFSEPRHDTIYALTGIVLPKLPDIPGYNVPAE